MSNWVRQLADWKFRYGVTEETRQTPPREKHYYWNVMQSTPGKNMWLGETCHPQIEELYEGGRWLIWMYQ
jgi:hypothetical protein